MNEYKMQTIEPENVPIANLKSAVKKLNTIVENNQNELNMSGPLTSESTTAVENATLAVEEATNAVKEANEAIITNPNNVDGGRRRHRTRRRRRQSRQSRRRQSRRQKSRRTR